MKNKVILISVDGMRPDGFLGCEHSFTKRMLKEFSYTLTGCSMKPSVTLPCHTSIFYGVPPARHGIVTNAYVPPVRPIKGIAERLADAGKMNAAFYNWEPMRHVWSSETMMYTLFINAYTEENTDLILTQHLIDLVQKKEPDFIFLHMVETDEKGGHDFGWMSSEYLGRVSSAISCVEKIYNTAFPKYNIIVTADHGGHERMHGTDCPEDMTIPMFFGGDGFEGGKDLGEISLLDIAPTILAWMNMPPSAEWQGSSLITK